MAGNQKSRTSNQEARKRHEKRVNLNWLVVMLKVE